MFSPASSDHKHFNFVRWFIRTILACILAKILQGIFQEINKTTLWDRPRQGAAYIKELKIIFNHIMIFFGKCIYGLQVKMMFSVNWDPERI